MNLNWSNNPLVFQIFILKKFSIFWCNLKAVFSYLSLNLRLAGRVRTNFQFNLSDFQLMCSPLVLFGDHKNVDNKTSFFIFILGTR